MSNLKNKAWETLCKFFNSKHHYGYYNEKCLKFKYDNLINNNKIHTFKLFIIYAGTRI